MQDFILILCGVLLVLVGLPIFNMFSGVIQALHQWIIAKINVHIATNNLRTQNRQAEMSLRAINSEDGDTISLFYNDDPDEI